MTLTIFIIIILIAIFAKDERDNLRYKNKHVLFPNWSWYVENRWNTKSFWIKNVFTLFNDGDNWWEWWNEYIKYYAIAYVGYFYFGYSYIWTNIIAIGSFFIGGGFHSLRNGSVSKFFNNKKEK